LWGPILGAFLLELAQQYLAYSLGGSQFYLIAYALVFLLVIILLPRGIVPSVRERVRQRRRRRDVDTRPAGGPPRLDAADGTPLMRETLS
jgi:branched-chain amino acid transport system permease protein